MALYAGKAASNPTFKMMFDSQKAFQKDATLWNQISERACDTLILREPRRWIGSPIKRKPVSPE